MPAGLDLRAGVELGFARVHSKCESHTHTYTINSELTRSSSLRRVFVVGFVSSRN